MRIDNKFILLKIPSKENYGCAFDEFNPIMFELNKIYQFNDILFGIPTYWFDVEGYAIYIQKDKIKEYFISLREYNLSRLLIL